MLEQNSFELFLNKQIKIRKNSTIDNSSNVRDLISDEYFELLCTYHDMSQKKREYIKETIQNLIKHNM